MTLELITHYLPGEYVIAKHEEYFVPLGSRRLYSYVAEVAFEYARLLGKSGRDEEANEKYREGIQALTAYGFRKDRTLSEILDCSVPYQQTYGSLSVEWFYDLYRMAMTVVTHTDGRSTSSYPVEWFKEFIKVYPLDALRFLVSETIENPEARWHQEEEFYHVLEKHASLFTPTQWFLLCRSLPMASSDEIIQHGLLVLDQIDESLQDVYSRWLMLLPLVVKGSEEATYPPELVTKFKEQFGVLLKKKEERIEQDDQGDAQLVQEFSATSIVEALAFLEQNSLTIHHAEAFQKLVASITDWEEAKGVLSQAARGFKYNKNVWEWVVHLFEPGSREWLYFNVCLFVFSTDGWYHGLNDTRYLKRSYENDPKETLLSLKEVLSAFLSGDIYTGLISSNLIKALAELEVEESQVHDLLLMIFHIVERRLPHPPNLNLNETIHKGLEDFNHDEIVVALLIARLKTLTTEKTQGIIWSLTYIASATPEILFRPYHWAFSNSSFLLSIHRGVLLQILKEYVDPALIPIDFIGQLIRIYPTGFFLEDQYIRSFVGYSIELDETSAKSIQHEAHQYDEGFFPYMHLKYRTLNSYFRPLKGTYQAYAYKRDEISKKHNSYYIRSEEVITPIVSLANASYEIANSQFYAGLKELTYYYGVGYTCNLSFFLPEIILQIGALTRRPGCIPNTEEFPSFEVRDTSTPFRNENWIVLASKETELHGESFKSKKNRCSSLVLTADEKPKPENELYAQYLFRAYQYQGREIKRSSLDQPICMLDIVDTLERSNIIYVSPYIIRKLGLKINSNFQNGFQACNEQGEVIITMANWKESYYGSVSDGTEVPRLKGVAVMIRADYYDRLLAQYDNNCCFVLSQDDTEKCA